MRRMIHIFIVNPYAGKKTFADDLREKLQKIEGLNYFVFNTRYGGYEVELVQRVRRIFQGEKLRFYCCGGSGTMKNMLSGFECFDDVEMAFFPCGLTNDFLKVFGDKAIRFQHIEELINGDVVDIDYIKSNYGIALNTLSTGLDAYSQTRMEKYRVLNFLGRQLPYSISLLSAMLFAKNSKFSIEVDNVERNGGYTEIVMANGFVLGGSIRYDKGADIQDGKGIYGFLKSCNGIKRFVTFFELAGGNFEKTEKLLERGYCQRISIKKMDESPFTLNLDGELIKDVSYVEATIVRKGLHFVVPKGVMV